MHTTIKEKNRFKTYFKAVFFGQSDPDSLKIKIKNLLKNTLKVVFIFCLHLFTFLFFTTKT